MNHLRFLTSYYRCLLPLLIALFFVTVTNGQPMTLQQAVKQGLDNNRQLKISSYKVSLAEIKYKQAVDVTLPSLSATAGYTRQSDLVPPSIQLPGFKEPVTLFPIYVNNYIGKVSLYETIFSGGRLKYAEQSQQLLEQASKLDAVKDQDEVVFSIISSYFNLYKLQQSSKIVDENLQLLDERIKEASDMEKNGVLLHNDVLRIQLQHSNTELTQIDLKNNLLVADFDFNILIGANEKSIVAIDSNEVKDMPVLKTLDEYMADAIKNRSDLQAITTRTKSLENNFRIAQNSYYPQIGISANWYDMRPNPRVIPPEDKFITTWDAGIALTWDLTNLYSNRHNVSGARIQLQQSQETTLQLEDGIKMEINENYVACTQSLAKIKVIETSRQQAEENFRIMNLRYKNGLALTSDYLDADVSLVQTQINLMLAKADASINYYRLLKSAGVKIF
jgi:outer membrane protein